MKFEDQAIVFDTTGSPEKCLVDLLAIKMCDEQSRSELTNNDKANLQALIQILNDQGLNYAQFNELLLLINQNRVSECFFSFFFNNRIENINDLLGGIKKFRGYAFLCYGNIKYAYKILISCRSIELLKKHLSPYCNGSEEVLDSYRNRHSKALEIHDIQKDKTWLGGYLAKEIYEADFKRIRELSRSNNSEINELSSLAKHYANIGEDIESVQAMGERNTDIYLTWDYLDVYISTSMRKSWEFEETYDFVNALLSDGTLSELNLRVFNPTQSYCSNRINKGLVEGLMLKRATANVYMAQEMDTLGKDSELAATLAQGKPVIAYVPKIVSIPSHIDKIKERPMDFHEARCLLLRAEKLLRNQECISEINMEEKTILNTIDEFLRLYQSYRNEQKFSLWCEKEKEFKQEHREIFKNICRIIAISDKYSYEKRAKTLTHIHPLSVQVNLETGVANGVLVVREIHDCAKLLRKILLNEMEFSTEYIGEKGKGVWTLIENISKCPFRVITDNERITNSFWNFYLTK